MNEKIITWFKTVTGKKWMMYFLAFNAFFESVILPVPIDIFTFTLSAAHPKKWWKYGTVATIFSVAGAIFGYFLGAYLFEAFGEQMIAFYGYEEEFVRVTELFNRNVFWVMFMSAFTPIPYKVFTIAGGALNVALWPFVIASILGRGLRFFAECYIPYRYGEKVGKHILKNFNHYLLVIAIIGVCYAIIRYGFGL
ncbi:MAG: VTT domain-containing protein [Candidatus Pacebacteria bacterium]|nr:VTT domain-containing protein [Candidatus Paceibacterota bacterium]